MNMAIDSVADVDEFADARERAFEELYERAFPFVARFVGARRGSLEDAKDIFQDALVIYYEKQGNKKIDIQTSEEAYIVGVAKHLWLRKNKNDQKLVALDAFESSIEIPADYFHSFSSNHVLEFLERSGKKCLDLLKSFYYEKRSPNAIAKSFGYRSEHSASVQKFKCLEKLREEVKLKSISYENFLE